MASFSCSLIISWSKQPANFQSFTELDRGGVFRITQIEKLFSIKKIHFKRSVIFVVNQKGGVGKICFIIICEIRWVNSSIYMFF